MAALDASLSERVGLHCIGGFVVCVFYGLPRVTGDIDYYTAIPAYVDLHTIAGKGSPHAVQHKIWLQRVAVNTMPEAYETRLTEMFPEEFKNLRLFAPDPYDYILSKLERNSGKERDDADYLFKTQHLDSQTLRESFVQKLFTTFESHDF